MLCFRYSPRLCLVFRAFSLACLTGRDPSCNDGLQRATQSRTTPSFPSELSADISLHAHRLKHSAIANGDAICNDSARMTITRKVITRIAAACFALAMMVSGLTGAVLCVGEDGQLSFKLPHQGYHCAETDNEHEGASPYSAEGGFAQHDDCSAEACVDVSLFPDAIVSWSHTVGHKTLLKLASPRSLSNLFSSQSSADLSIDRVSASQGALQRLGISPQLFARSTVVLRV